MPFPGKILWRISILCFVAALLFAGALAFRTQSQGKELFRLNQRLVEEGYYMAGFEFKMMGIVYYLDKGRYWQALSTLSRFHDQLETREGLRKIPGFQSAAEEMEFFLSLQNPETGAFMDSAFPTCTYNEPTENVVAHLAALSQKSGEPLRLIYPLRYLDPLDKPDELRAFLDDVSDIGWLGNVFPETTYVFARSLAGLLTEESAIRENGLHHFSPDSLHALRDWFYQNQDPETGFWGPRLRGSGKLARLDLNNTASMIKLFVDSQGNNLNTDFPLRYREELIDTTLGLIDRPMPESDDLDDWHDWNISTTKGIRMLVRYLWSDLTQSQQERARGLLEEHVRIKFQRFYVPEDGAFSLYPDTGQASLDGTATMILGSIGAFSTDRQTEMWGPPGEMLSDLGQIEAEVVTQEHLVLIADKPEINSLRVYLSPPDAEDLMSNVAMVIYPRETPIMDASDLVPKVVEWLGGKAPALGNWASKTQLMEDYAVIGAGTPEAIALEAAPAALSEALDDVPLTVIGFDILQIPLFRLEIRKPEPA